MYLTYFSGAPASFDGAECDITHFTSVEDGVLKADCDVDGVRLR